MDMHILFTTVVLHILNGVFSVKVRPNYLPISTIHLIIAIFFYLSIFMASWRVSQSTNLVNDDMIKHDILSSILI